MSRMISLRSRVFFGLILGSVIASSPFLQRSGMTQGTVPSPSPSSSLKSFPANALVNVKTVYGARGDGITDDTRAIQAALADGRSLTQDYYGRPKALYFPAGIYLVSNTLNWNGCCVTLQGQGAGQTFIKLKDATPGFNSPTTPKAVIKTPNGNMSFRQNIHDLAVDTGRNNPGAIGIDYISSNTGVLKNVLIRSGDRQGVAGLDMTRTWPGPSLTKNVTIQGFDFGIRVGNTEYGPTFENITLNNQRVAGIGNYGNTLALRAINSTNTVPAIQNLTNQGSVILLDSRLQGGATTVSAVQNTGYLYARNVSTTGYRSAISNATGALPGTAITQYISGTVYSLFPSPARSLGLPIQETPDSHDNNLANWQQFVPRWYGDTAPLQTALNSGKSTIYFPMGGYLFYRPTVVTIPATVERVIGFSSVINSGPGGGLTLRVVGNSLKPLIIEQFGYGVTVEQASTRTVVVKHGAYAYKESSTAGDLFLEDVVISPLNLSGPRRVWARQLNAERTGFTKITNNGSKLWILGLKTEGTGTVISTLGGGFTELLGTLIYPSRAFNATELTQPAFVSRDSSQSLIYSFSVYCTGCNYDIQVQETRNGVTRQLKSSGLPWRMPLFTGYP